MNHNSVGLSRGTKFLVDIIRVAQFSKAYDKCLCAFPGYSIRRYGLPDFHLLIFGSSVRTFETKKKSDAYSYSKLHLTEKESKETAAYLLGVERAAGDRSGTADPQAVGQWECTRMNPKKALLYELSLR
jgi:hypothetical protein